MNVVLYDFKGSKLRHSSGAKFCPVGCVARICTTAGVDGAWVAFACGRGSGNFRGDWVERVLRALSEAFLLLFGRFFLVRGAPFGRDGLLIWTSPWGVEAALAERLLLAVEPNTDDVMLGN